MTGKPLWLQSMIDDAHEDAWVIDPYEMTERLNEDSWVRAFNEDCLKAILKNRSNPPTRDELWTEINRAVKYVQEDEGVEGTMHADNVRRVFEQLLHNYDILPLACWPDEEQAAAIAAHGDLDLMTTGRDLLQRSEESSATTSSETERKRKRDHVEDKQQAEDKQPAKKAKSSEEKKTKSAKPKWLTSGMIEDFRVGSIDMEVVVKAITKAFRKTSDAKKFDKLEDELAKAHSFLKSMENMDDEELQSSFDSVYDDTSIIPRKWREDGGDDY